LKAIADPPLSSITIAPLGGLRPSEIPEFRLGGDQLLADDNGKSRISMEDFAIAMVDELERPTHSRRRFTVGY
jgi:putative NADH-flavin reductase